MKTKIKKGDFAYYDHKRVVEIIRTIVYFAISASLYIAGYATTHSNKNLLTIVAVLGCLPACKSLVNTIMYMRYHGCEKEVYDRVKEVVSPFLHGYGFVFTTYKLNFEASVAVVKNGYVYVLIANHSDKMKELEEHIHMMASQNGMKAFVGIYDKEEAFLERLKQLTEKENEDEKKDKEIYQLLTEISL